MAENLTYQSTSPDLIDPTYVTPPVPQLAPLVEFIQNPQKYVEDRPSLQLQFRNPSVEISNQQNDLGNWLREINKGVQALPYNKYDTKPIEFDRRAAELYKDPELGFIPGRDNESFYDADQSWLGDIGRNVLGFSTNFAGNAVATIVSTPYAIANTINWVANGMDSESFSKVYDNPISRSISDWMDEMQVATRNFRNEREREAEKNPLLNLIPFYGNGFGDAIRSLGYGAGGLAGVAAEELAVSFLTAGTGTVPTLAAGLGRLIKTGGRTENALQAAKAFANAERVAQGINTTGRVVDAADQLLGGRFGARAILSSLSEASFEALETQKNLELQMINDYRDKNGFDPTLDEISTISQVSRDAANARYLLNVALLSVSNGIQFDSLFKSFPMARYFGNESSKIALEVGERGFQQAAGKEILNTPSWYQSFKSTFQPGGLANAAKSTARGVGQSLARSGSEAFEEGFQNAFDLGTQYYAENKFEGRDWLSSSLNGATRALRETVTTSEGWNAILQGFVAGEIQGRAASAISAPGEKRRNQLASLQRDLVIGGANKYFTDSEGKTDVNKVAQLFNIHSIGGSVTSKIDNTAAQVGIQKKARTAVENNDQQAFQTQKDALQFGFLTSFVANNQYDALNDIIGDWRNLANNDVEAFKKQFGLETPATTQQGILDSLQSLQDKADRLKDVYDNINLTFNNTFKSGTPQYQAYNNYKQEMVYQMFQYERMKQRYMDLAGDPLNENFTHLQAAFNSQELRGALNEVRDNLKLIEEVDNLVDEDINLPGLSLAVAEDQAKRDALDRIETLLENNLTEDQAQDFMLLVDQLLGTNDLRNQVQIPQILSNISDMVKLQRNQEGILNTFKKLTTKNGFEEFQKIDEELAKQAESKQNQAQREAQLAEEQRIKEEENLQRRNQVQTQFEEQLQTLSEETGTPVDELERELVESGAELTQENVDTFVNQKVVDTLLSEIPTEQGGTLVVDPRTEYVANPKALQGKFFKYDSGSDDGARGWRYAENVGETNERGLTTIDSVDFNEDGSFKRRSKAKFYRLADLNKFSEVADSSVLPELFAQVQQTLTPTTPTVPSVTVKTQSEPKTTGSFLQFFTGTGEVGVDRAERILTSDLSTLTISRNPYPQKKRSSLQSFVDRVNKTFENEEYLVNSDASPNNFSVELSDAQGSLGYFLPLSSYYVLAKSELGGKTDPRKSIYELVDDVVQRKDKRSLDKLQAVTTGSIQDLILGYHLENIFKNAPQGTISLEMINRKLEAQGIDPIQFKAYFRGTNSPKNLNLAEGSFPLLKDMRINRNKSFVYVDSEGAKQFEGSSLSQQEIDNALTERKSLIQGGRSRLSSYTLFTQDSSGFWAALPVRTIPITNQVERATALEDQIKAKAIQDFPNLTPREQMQFLNDQLFYQDANAKGHFNVSSNGRLEFYTSSLSRNPEQGNGRRNQPSETITTYLDNGANGINYDFTNFSFDSFAQAIADDVASKAKGSPDGGKIINITKDNFRFKERFGKQTADEFGDFRVIAENTLPFNTVNISYFSAPNQTNTEPETEQEEVKPEDSAPVKAIKEVRNKQIKTKAPEFFLATPNAKGEFGNRIYRFDASSVAFEASEGENGFEVSVSSDPVIQSDLARNPELYIAPVFDWAEGTQNDPNAFETVEPAIYKADGVKLTLVKKGKIRGYKRGIDSPSLKMESSQLEYLVQKALREC